MTPEQIRIAVAEEVLGKGFSLCQTAGTFCVFDTDDKHYNDSIGNAIPNYPSDLNACHEMEKSLSREEHGRFRFELWNIVERRTDDGAWERNYVSARAIQRCEAFLRVKGKWKE